MLFEKFPFSGDSTSIIKAKIINQELRFPAGVAMTEEVVDLIKGALAKDPAQRFDLFTMKTHKWLLLSDSAI